MLNHSPTGHGVHLMRELQGCPALQFPASGSHYACRPWNPVKSEAFSQGRAAVNVTRRKNSALCKCDISEEIYSKAPKEEARERSSRHIVSRLDTTSIIRHIRTHNWRFNHSCNTRRMTWITRCPGIRSSTRRQFHLINILDIYV